MEQFKQLSSRYIRQQRKRSFLTVLGIILSIALIVTVGTMLLALRNIMYNEDAANGGEYAVAYRDLNEKQAELAGASAGIKDQYATARLGSVCLEDFGETRADGYDGRYLNLTAVTGDGFKHHAEGYSLEEGRIPENDGELTVERWMLKYLSPYLMDGTKEAGVGSKIALPAGGIRREYTITGIQGRSGGKLNYDGKACTYSKTLDGVQFAERYSVYAAIPFFSDPEKTANEVLNNLRKISDTVSMELNNYQLTLSGRSLVDQYNSALLTLFLIISGIIVIASVSVIYNAFNIAVVERMNQYGTLRCIGATPRQIRSLVRHEAIVMCGLAIPPGIALGLLASYIVTVVIRAMKIVVISDYISLSFSLPVILAAALLGVVTVLLSARKPARLAASVSPVEAVRGTGIAADKGAKAGKGSVYRLLFGFEGDIASRNTRRNKSRFRLTVFSMSISIVLFLVFSSLGESLQSMINFNTISGADFVVESEDGNAKLSDYEAMAQKISGINGVSRSTVFTYGSAAAILPEDKVTATGKRYLAQPEENGENGSPAAASTSDKPILQAIVVKGTPEILQTLSEKMKSGDTSGFEQSDGIIVLSGKSNEPDYHTLKPGDSVELFPVPYFSINPILTRLPEAKAYPVSAIVGDTVFGEKIHAGQLYIILPPALYDAADFGGSTGIVVLDQEKADNAQVEKDLQSTLDKSGSPFVYTNVASAQRVNRNIKNAINIFVYGFIIVIVLISSLNIINTITTGILTRRRELSVLRAVGMDMGMLRRMTVLECLRYGVVSCLWGGVAGTLLSYWVGKSVLTFGAVDLTVNWMKILIAFAAAMLISCLAATVPVKRLDEKEIVEGIRAVE